MKRDPAAMAELRALVEDDIAAFFEQQATPSLFEEVVPPLDPDVELLSSLADKMSVRRKASEESPKDICVTTGTLSQQMRVLRRTMRFCCEENEFILSFLQRRRLLAEYEQFWEREMRARAATIDQTVHSHHESLRERAAEYEETLQHDVQRLLEHVVKGNNSTKGANSSPPRPRSEESQADEDYIENFTVNRIAELVAITGARCGITKARAANELLLSLAHHARTLPGPLEAPLSGVVESLTPILDGKDGGEPIIIDPPTRKQ